MGQGRQQGRRHRAGQEKRRGRCALQGHQDNGPCNTTPLVLEVNARERYAEYFNPFFSDGGEYKKFVREETGNQASRLEAKGTSINNWGVIVTVDREGLRQQLEKDGVLKPGTRN